MKFEKTVVFSNSKFHKVCNYCWEWLGYFLFYYWNKEFNIRLCPECYNEKERNSHKIRKLSINLKSEESATELVSEGRERGIIKNE